LVGAAWPHRDVIRRENPDGFPFDLFLPIFLEEQNHA
jgi:hypothetical protein